MAHNDTEIEIKVPLTKRSFDKVKRKLGKIAKITKKSHHIDEYYSPVKDSFLEPKYPFEWLTLRRRDGRILLNYKHWYPENTKNTTHCDEYETEIKDKNKLSKILNALNFKKFVTVDKYRTTFNYQDRLEIALDKVRDLGYFIEIEALDDFGGVEKTRREILKFAHLIGIDKIESVPGGYGAAVMRKKHLL